MGGAALAVVVAVALSGRYPIGIGRQLELDRGVDVNLAVVGLGALTIVLFVMGFSFVFGRRPASPDPAASSPATLAGWLASAGAPLDAVIGTRFAFERGRGSRSMPSCAAIAGGAAALGIVVAAAMFVAGLDRLYSVPTERGWAWDAVIGNVNFELSDATARSLATDSRIETLTMGRHGAAELNGAATEVLAIDPMGTAPPEMLSGRLPMSASEVALGARLLDRLGVEIGDVVTLSVEGGELDVGEPTNDVALTVVGATNLPVLGEAGLGEIALLTLDAVAAAGGNHAPQVVLARFRDDDVQQAATSLDRDFSEEILTDSIPACIVNLHRVRGLPLLGFLLAGAMGTIVLAYPLATGVRTRLRKLAILRALGARANRVGRVLAWQGVALAGAMVVIGLPVGLLLGSTLWRSVADSLGVRSSPVVTPSLFLLVPMSVLVAIAASVYPASASTPAAARRRAPAGGVTERSMRTRQLASRSARSTGCRWGVALVP